MRLLSLLLRVFFVTAAISPVNTAIICYCVCYLSAAIISVNAAVISVSAAIISVNAAVISVGAAIQLLRVKLTSTKQPPLLEFFL